MPIISRPNNIQFKQWKEPLEARMQWKLPLLPPKCHILLDLGCGKLTPYRNYLKNRADIVIFADLCKSPYISIRLSAEKLPFKNKAFDFVWSSELLEHVIYPQEMINEIFRITNHALIFYSTQLHVIDHKHVDIDFSPFLIRASITGSVILAYGDIAQNLVMKSPCKNWGKEIHDVYIPEPIEHSKQKLVNFIR